MVAVRLCLANDLLRDTLEEDDGRRLLFFSFPVAAVGDTAPSSPYWSDDDGC